MSMVKVRLLQQMSGTRNGEPWPERGEVMEVGEDEAAALTNGQTPIAEIVELPKAPESPVDAQVNGGETAPANASAAGAVKPKQPSAKPPVVRTARPSAGKTAGK